nr:MAG TPA: hypothetical protein [Crassvirales sp.]
MTVVSSFSSSREEGNEVTPHIPLINYHLSLFIISLYEQ